MQIQFNSRKTPIIIMLLFALNLVTLLMQIQYSPLVKGIEAVVICFKFSNFAYANTVQFL